MLLTVITHYIALTDLLLALFVAECTEDTVHTNEHIRTQRERQRERERERERTHKDNETKSNHLCNSVVRL